MKLLKVNYIFAVILASSMSMFAAIPGSWTYTAKTDTTSFAIDLKRIQTDHKLNAKTVWIRQTGIEKGTIRIMKWGFRSNGKWSPLREEMYNKNQRLINAKDIKPYWTKVIPGTISFGVREMMER